ncbi:MAG: GntR family transcriptional regulator [Victivallales bacterium]
MDTNKYILQELSKSASLLKDRRKTGLKFPLIREILQKIVSSVPSETQLPSIRVIAKILGTSILPVHKAMSELKSEGFITARSTSGYFTIARRNQNGAESSRSSSFELHHGSLKFATDSAAPYQKIFWNQALKSVSSKGQNLLPDIDMMFSSFNSCEEIIESNIDIIECSLLLYHKLGISKSSLEIDDFIPRGRGMPCLDGSPLTIYFLTSYFYYNLDYLDKLKLPHPSYRTFSGQKEYFRLIRNSMGIVDSGIWCGSSVQPAMFLGGFFKMLTDSLPGLATGRKQNASLEKAFNDIMDFCSLFLYRESPVSNGKDMDFFFENGLCPFLVAGSNNYWRMLAEKPPFSWSAYPMLTVDNSILKIPIYASVLKGTRDPVGAVQFILSLLDGDVQKMFSSIGFLPVNNSFINLKDMAEGDIDYFRKKIEGAAPFYLKDYSSFYIFNKILGPELFKSSLGNQDGKDVFGNTVKCAVAYLSGNFR